MTLGVKHNTVKLVKFNKDWAKHFESEKKRLEKILGKHALAIEHIGSTAIHGLKSKPIIDITVGVPSLKLAKKYVKMLENAGYVNPDIFRQDQHLMFSKRMSGVTTHHIHVVRHKGEIWKNHIGFRDHMRSNSKALKEYLKLKEKMGKKFANDRPGYTKSKEEYVKRYCIK